MNWESILALAWTAVNSPVGITTIAAILLLALNRLYASKPLWQQYEGTIIAAVKFAEREIDNDVENKSLARLDEALRYVLKVYEQMNGRRANQVEMADLTEGIQIVHAQLEAAGNLK